MKCETVKVKDKDGNDTVVNVEDAHLYEKFNKPAKKKPATKKAK